MEKIDVLKAQEDVLYKVREWLKPGEQWALWEGEDTLILKKVLPARLSDIASRSPEKGMPLEEIVAEVHRYRQEKKASGGN